MGQPLGHVVVANEMAGLFCAVRRHTYDFSCNSLHLSSKSVPAIKFAIVGLRLACFGLACFVRPTGSTNITAAPIKNRTRHARSESERSLSCGWSTG